MSDPKHGGFLFMDKKKLINKYDKQVSIYENNLNNSTLNNWRSQIIKDAYGKVMEVGVGVGANFPYYDKDKVTEITGVDFSTKMIESAQETALKYNVNADFINHDISTIRLEANSYDSIVSTLTLCSYPDPVDTLNKFNSWCKKGGTILLMEHGLSTNPLLSMAMKGINPLYNRISGCHCNRNIVKLVEKSNLKIERIDRFWSGIFVLVWARPTKS